MYVSHRKKVTDVMVTWRIAYGPFGGESWERRGTRLVSLKRFLSRGQVVRVTLLVWVVVPNRGSRKAGERSLAGFRTRRR